MQFNTQVCTTREQSERLVSLGLKKNTADCHWCYHSVTATWYIVAHEYDNIGSYIPAWSLHRLMSLCPQTIHLDEYADSYYRLTINPYKVIYIKDDKQWLKQFDEGNLYDRMIDMIEWLIKNNHLNKEYLEL